MKSVLDDGYTWFLGEIAYGDSGLAIHVIEGFREPEPEDLEILHHVIRDTYGIGRRPESRRVTISFGRTVAWQCVDESWTAFDRHEVREDDSRLQVLTRSKYLDYVHTAHGWFTDVVGPAKHYRIWTEDEVIDVVAFDPPAVHVESE